MKTKNLLSYSIIGTIFLTFVIVAGPTFVFGSGSQSGPVAVTDAGSGASVSVDDNGVTLSIDDGGGLVTVNGIVTPTDNFSNPTESINTRTLNSEWDGAAWDRTRHSFTQETTGITTVSTGTAVDMSTTPMHFYTMIVDRTAGAEDVVEINLECSINGTAFIVIAAITSLVSEPALINPVETVPCNEMRYDVVDEGAGNTLAIDLLATR